MVAKKLRHVAKLLAFWLVIAGIGRGILELAISIDPLSGLAPFVVKAALSLFAYMLPIGIGIKVMLMISETLAGDFDMPDDGVISADRDEMPPKVGA